MFLYFIYLHIRSNENDGAILFYYPVGKFCTASCAGRALFPPTKDDKTLRLQSPARASAERGSPIPIQPQIRVGQFWKCSSFWGVDQSVYNASPNFSRRGSLSPWLHNFVTDDSSVALLLEEKIETNNQPSRMVYNRNIGIAIQLNIVLLDHAMIKSVC